MAGDGSRHACHTTQTEARQPMRYLASNDIDINGVTIQIQGYITNEGEVQGRIRNLNTGQEVIVKTFQDATTCFEWIKDTTESIFVVAPFILQGRL